MTEPSIVQRSLLGGRWTTIAPPGAFRLMLAFGVVLSHISAIEVGRLAVILFFLLSGYWTSRIWREKFDSSLTGWFYLSRYLRVFPLFFLVTLAAAAARKLDLHLVNFTLLGVGSTNHDPTGVSWSLDIELQFYLLLPLIIGLVSRHPRSALAISLAAAFVGVWLDDTYQINTVAQYLPAFTIGALIYEKTWQPSTRAANLSLAAFAIATAATFLTPFGDKTRPNPFDDDLWALIWMAPLLPYIAHSLTIRSSKLDRHFGNLSFPLYLVHFPIIAMMTSQLGNSLVIKAAAVSLSIALAVALYLLADRPIDRMRVRLTERSASAST